MIACSLARQPFLGLMLTVPFPRIHPPTPFSAYLLSLRGDLAHHYVQLTLTMVCLSCFSCLFLVVFLFLLCPPIRFGLPYRHAYRRFDQEHELHVSQLERQANAGQGKLTISMRHYRTGPNATVASAECPSSEEEEEEGGGEGLTYDRSARAYRDRDGVIITKHNAAVSATHGGAVGNGWAGASQARQMRDKAGSPNRDYLLPCSDITFLYY